MAGDLPDHLRPAAEYVFGPEFDRAVHYARLLATDGLTRGLLGPREADRLWDRHLLNSAVVAELLPDGADVVDVGSGAGLPGIPLALARSDLRIALLEPMLRRTTFLSEVVAELGLEDRVFVVRGRAPEDAAALPFSPDYVTARAVAPLERLVSWTMPLVRQDGTLLALRGASAADEVASAREVVLALAGTEPELLEVGDRLLPELVRVVRVVRRTPPRPARGKPHYRRRGTR
ncbi:MAG TPA: 16S rRNA (guanine(527)-N(7))-methyltransferase RsmG [Frankiaceae bacterium]|nr:16S rRNA (guanine(527)-N(7))-methyltransferase RsmG [Frankiaceae bacterium]